MTSRWRGEGAQHQGARPYQEDSWALKPLADGSLLAVLADGMGGHAGAHRLEGRRRHRRRVGREGRQPRRRPTGGKPGGRREGRERPQPHEHGRDVLAVTVKGEEMRWVSVGDSPLYLVAGGRIERLNADHSMAPQIDAMVARGLLTARQAANHPGRHTLREAVMGNPLTLIDEGSRRLRRRRPGCCCAATACRASTRRASRRERKDWCSALIEAVLALRAPHQDNVTVIKLEREE